MTLELPRPGELHVWWALLPEGGLGGARDALAADVDPATLERLGRMRLEADRDRGLLGHAVLRRLLAAATGGAPAAVRLEVACASCGSTEHGKPYLAAAGAPEFNLSHSGRVVAVALAPAGVPVGVDVEHRARAVNWDQLRRNVFGDAEWAATAAAADPDAARFAGWARKEAAVKATGHGLALPLSQVDVAGGAAEGWTAVLPEGAGRVAGADVVTAPEHAGAVAAVVAAGEGAGRVVVRRAGVPG